MNSNTIQRLVPFCIALLISVITSLTLHKLEEAEVDSMSMTLLTSCPRGLFRLSGMDRCQHHLGCQDLSEAVEVYHDVILDYGASKVTKLARWSENKRLVAISTPIQPFLQSGQEFSRHLAMLKLLQDQDQIIQLVGYCETPGQLAFVTEYQRVKTLVASTIRDRLRLCISYAELLAILHRDKFMLDYEDEVLLVRDLIVVQGDDGDERRPWPKVVLGQVDNLREVNDTAVNSKHNHDIWLAPQICNTFLAPEDKEAKKQLGEIHRQCRDKDPDKRPNATQLIRSYRDVLQMFQLHYSF